VDFMEEWWLPKWRNISFFRTAGATSPTVICQKTK
jgi:hypothetical protein